ncbi:MAG: DUF493 family protein [Gammaproteobacteria bacterium]|nr:DUF493 family protein [Gammaproteobacteria bacterium]
MSTQSPPNDQTPSGETTDVWQFPMDFPFKVMGLQREGFIEEVLTVVQAHCPGDYSPRETASAKGNYTAVTVVLRIESKLQIDTLYQAVWSVEGVKFVL